MIDIGIALAGMVALIKGVQSVYQRKNALDTDEFITAWSSRAFGVPILLLALAYTGIPDLGYKYFLMVIPLGAVTALASWMIAKAYKESEASIVTPMFALSPILVLFTSFFMLGEIPSLQGIVGIIFVTLGAYLLKIKDASSVLEPIKNLWKERGVQIILVVIVIYAVTANLDKIGVKVSSPIMWPLGTYIVSSIFLLPVMALKSKNWKTQVSSQWRPLALLGVLGAISIIFQMMAIEITLVSYVISIKRLSIPVTVIFSFFLLDEKDSFRERIAGSGLMALGALLISL